MEAECSLPHSQEQVSCPFPEPDRISLHPHVTVPEDVLILFSHLPLGLPGG
jgi:hypothetical protein